MVAWRVLREPTVPILLAASVVHVVRRDLVDLLLFSGTAAVILVDAQRRDAPDGRAGRPESSAPASDDGAGPGLPERPVAAWLILAGMTLLAAGVALAAPASWGARLVLVLIGLGALVLVLVRPARTSAPPSTARGWPVWAVIGVAACLWELTSFIAQQVWASDQDAHPAVSDLVEPLLQTWLGRAVFLLLWAGAGWWLLRQMIGGGTGSGRSEVGRRSDEPVRRHIVDPPLTSRPDGHEAGR